MKVLKLQNGKNGFRENIIKSDKREKLNCRMSIYLKLIILYVFICYKIISFTKKSKDSLSEQNLKKQCVIKIHTAY